MVKLLRDGKIPSELRNIRSQRKHEPSLCVGPARTVVLKQTFAYVAGSHANDRVLARVVGGSSPEQINPDRSLLQGLEIARDRLFHNMLEKLRAAMASPKCRARKYFLEMLADKGYLGRSFRDFGRARVTL